MKKLYVFVMIFGLAMGSFAQIKTTGDTPIDLGGFMSVKLVLNKANNSVNMTLTGPSDRLFCISFGQGAGMAGTSNMGSFTANSPTTAIDSKGFAGKGIIVEDTQQDWTIVSDVPNGATRTIVATRALTNSDPDDYQFDFDALSNLDIMYAQWRTAGEYALNGKDQGGAGTVTTRHNNTTDTRGYVNAAFSADIKSSGTIVLDSDKPMSVRLDMDKTSGKLFMTITGPSDRWLNIGLNVQVMAGADYAVLSSPTEFISAQPNNDISAHATLVAKAVNVWTIESNTVNGETRTVIVSRNLDTTGTGNANDVQFDYDNTASMPFIWGWCRYGDQDTDPLLAAKAFDYIATRHETASSGIKGRGIGVATFSTLSTKNFNSLSGISVYPNPSNGIFNIAKADGISISKVRVYDANAKLLNEINTSAIENISVDMSNYTNGLYFLEISNSNDKIVKKIMR